MRNTVDRAFDGDCGEVSLLSLDRHDDASIDLRCFAAYDFRHLDFRFTDAALTDVWDRLRNPRSLAPTMSVAGFLDEVNKGRFVIATFAWTAVASSVRTDVGLSSNGTRFAILAAAVQISHHAVTKVAGGFVRRVRAEPSFVVRVDAGTLVATPVEPIETGGRVFKDFTRPFG